MGARDLEFLSLASLFIFLSQFSISTNELDLN